MDTQLIKPTRSYFDCKIQTIFKNLKVVFLLLCTIFYCDNLFSQAISIFHNGDDVTNKEISIEGTVSVNQLIVYLVFKNNTSEAIHVKVRKIESSVVEGSQNSFCLGVCYAPYVYESSIPYSIPAGESTKDSIFSAEYFPRGLAGQSVIKYEVFDIDNPKNNKVSVTVNFISHPASGIDLKITCKDTIMVYPNPCNGDWITIKFNEASHVQVNKIIITNSLGVVLNSFLNTENTGIFSVEVSNFSNGLYFCSLIDKNERRWTEKIIINH